MPTEVKVIADSVSASGKRITTLQLKYQRMVHQELMTHRVFSRNASSSRAIPVAKMIDQVKNDPAMPVFWGKNQPGMQAADELTVEDLERAQGVWLNARDEAVKHVERLMEIGLHKQLANRLLEPWQYIHVVVTSTEWENFFELRCHPAAQPEIQQLAVMMREAMNESIPTRLFAGSWHIPYVTDEERAAAGHIDELLKMSAARCARVSYLNHEGKTTTLEEDSALYERLVGSHPIHASPCEHQATPDEVKPGTRMQMASWERPDLHGNFVGWKQHRKFIEQGYVIK